jgi:hypothetical protein
MPNFHFAVVPLLFRKPAGKVLQIGQLLHYFKVFQEKLSQV